MRASRANLSESSFITKIRLLDDTEISYEFKKDQRGQALLDFVCDQLDLIEKDYFGLRYVDNNKQRHWLDYTKEIAKQLKDTKHPYMFFFRLKYYPTDPTKLAEELTRYQVYLQLKRDILHGRLLCPFNNITDLAAHIVQAELGDYSEEEMGRNYLSDLKLLPRQSEKLEEKICEYHKTLKGYNPAEAENRFLNLARSQDLYGVDPHPCKDSEDLPLYLGLTPHGIQIIREARRVSGFPWRDVNKVSYDNRMFYIQILKNKEKTNYAFRLNDTPSCKHLWKCTVEHMAFYCEEPLKAQVMKKSALSPQSLFRRSKHRCSGKNERQIILERESLKRTNPKPLMRKSTLKVNQSQKLQNRLSMPNLMPASFPPASNNSLTNDNSSQTSQNSPNSEREKRDILAEFEVKDFPNTSESSKNSTEVDALSLSSSVDINSENVSNETSSSYRVEEVLEEDIIIPKEIPKVIVKEFIDETEIPNNNKVQTQANNTVSSFEELVKNPTFVLMLIAIALIPVSVLITLAVKS